MGYGQQVTNNGTTYSLTSYGNPVDITGVDGKKYDSIAAAEAAGKLYIGTSEQALEAGRIANKSARIDLEAKKAAIKNQAASSQMTNEFLSKWGDMNSKALEVLTGSLSGTLTGNTPASGIYGDLINNIQTQIKDFDTNYGDTTKQLMDTTMADINTRRGLVTNLTNMAQPDYEGVSGKAAADVGTQFETARGEMARDAMSYGVDPTSGKFGALSKKSTLGEARAKVEAMNRARGGEKERSAGLMTGAINAIDPSTSAGLATSLMNQRTGMLGLQTQAANALTTAEKAKSDTALGIANTIAGIGEQYGSLGSSMLGLQTAQGTYGGTGKPLSKWEAKKQKWSDRGYDLSSSGRITKY
jgi:hypothetical protein